MKFVDNLSLATRMFKNRPLRTFLTILGVSVGIGAVFFLVSLGYGLQKAILSRITTADSLLSLEISPGAANLVDLSESNLEKISAIAGVTEVARLASFSGQIVWQGNNGDGAVNAVDSSFFRLSGLPVQEGQAFTADDQPEAVISSATAQLFNLKPAEVLGQKVRLNVFYITVDENGFESVAAVEPTNDYTIVGVIEDDNASYVYVPIKTLGAPIAKYDDVRIKVASNEMMSSIRDQVIEQGFLVSSLSDTIEQANKIFEVVQIVLFSFGFIALVVSAIGMFNTMTIALLERTNEIGIMRSIGITRKDVRQMFLLESSIMGFFGGIGGLVVGFLGGELINLGINALARNFGGQSVDLFYSPLWFTLLIIGFSTVVGFFTGIYPSLRASKLNPLDALRYK